MNRFKFRVWHKKERRLYIYEGDKIKTYGNCMFNETVTPTYGVIEWTNENDADVTAGFVIKTDYGYWDFDCLDIEVMGNIN